MKTGIFKRGLSAFMAMLLCLSMVVNFGTTTAYAAKNEAEVFVISFPRDGDANYSGHWGHDALTYMNGWTSGSAAYYMKVRTIGSTEGNICYCIEPGVPLNIGDKLTEWDENFWDNYPAQYNNTIMPDDIKLLIGRIMQYGYTGTVSTSWRTQKSADADKMAHAMATQLLIWEVVVGERDADFNKVSTGGYNAICDQIAADHPLYSQIMSHYKSIETSVKSHSKLPTFFARSKSGAMTRELTWDGTKYTGTITDINNVLSNYTFSSNDPNVHFSVSGNQLTITSEQVPNGLVTVTASKNNAQRRGIITWSDGKLAPESNGLQDIVTFSASVTDPVTGYLNIKAGNSSLLIIKTSEDGNVSGIPFTVAGNGFNKTVWTNSGGRVLVENLAPGTYTVSELPSDKYEPQEDQQITIIPGQVANITFHNTLRGGDLTVTKTAEDGLVEGVRFHLYGTSNTGATVDEYAVTDHTGRALFRNVPTGNGYTLEEVDVPGRYVVPASQSATIDWSAVTERTFENRLKKWNATVTKRDSGTGSAQGDGSLAGAVYGVYQGDKLTDTYTTDSSGKFTTSYYPCGDDWSIREITPSEGYLLDTSSHHIGAEPAHYTAEYNSVALDVTEQVIKGNIAIIKHTDDGTT